LQRIKDKAETTMDNPVNFFAELRSAAALMTRDPNNVVQVERLLDMSRQAEWLEDLPGTSPIMNISERQWLAFGPNRQQQVIDVIDEKIRLYEEIYDNTDRWVRLHENQPEGDTVTTVPIDILP
jgi:serine/threonine-protein kinase PpkA